MREARTMFVPFLYPENPAPDAWLRRTYVFFISLFVRFSFSFLPFPFFRFFVSYKIVPQFDSIKDCYKKDGCIVYEDNYRQEQLGRYDNYKRILAVDNTNAITVWTPKCDKNKCKTPPVYRYTYFSQMDVVHRHFSRSYRNHDKDVIIF
jgi:hypothetical protein